jgi:hypothetical protein
VLVVAPLLGSLACNTAELSYPPVQPTPEAGSGCPGALSDSGACVYDSGVVAEGGSDARADGAIDGSADGSSDALTDGPAFDAADAARDAAAD